MDSDPLALKFFVNESESRQSLWNRIPVLDNRKILMLKLSFIKLRVNKYRYLHRFYCQNCIIMFFGGEGQVWELHPHLIRLNFLTDRIWDPGPSFTDPDLGKGYRSADIKHTFSCCIISSVFSTFKVVF